MKNLKIYKPIVLLATLSLSLVVTSAKSKVYAPEYVINSEYNSVNTDVAFATCSIGDIYIIKSSEIYKIEPNQNKRQILIIDERNSNDPNIQIKDSNSITDKEEMEEVLAVIQEYNYLYPSKWNRSIISMLNEWKIHNICSSLSLFSDHTDDVDLNNGDEYIYKSKILFKILQN